MGDHECSKPVWNVNVDAYAAGQMSVDYLWQLGHRQIALLCQVRDCNYQTELRRGVGIGGGNVLHVVDTTNVLITTARRDFVETNIMPAGLLTLNLRLDDVSVANPMSLELMAPNLANFTIPQHRCKNGDDTRNSRSVKARGEWKVCSRHAVLRDLFFHANRLPNVPRHARRLCGSYSRTSAATS
jgi:hypothetical protein